MILSMLVNHPKLDDGKLPQDVRDLIKLFLQLVQVPFQGGPPTPELYPPATDDPFFPCLPKCHGDASYEADKKEHTHIT